MLTHQNAESIPIVRNSTEIDLHISLLQHLKDQMKPQKKHFNLIQIFQMLYKFCQNIPNQTFEASAIKNIQNKKSQQQNQSTNSPTNKKTFQVISQPSSPMKKKKKDQQQLKQQQTSLIQKQVQQMKVSLALQQLDKFRCIFIFFQISTLSYELINEYMMNNQMKILKNINDLQNKASFMNLSDKRVRLDENVKLCIMPQGDSAKIKSIVVDYQIAIALDKKQPNPIQKTSNKQHIIQNQRIFAITNEYMRKIQVSSDKLKNSQFKKSNQKIPQTNTQASKKYQNVQEQKWYKYSDKKIKPKPIQVQSDLKLVSAKQTIIDAVSISSNLIGFITYDREFLIQSQLEKHLEQNKQRKMKGGDQIKIGNLIYDIPDQNLQKPIKQDGAKYKQMKQSKIILFQNYDDDLWIVTNQQFIYVYRIPMPNSGQFVNDQTQKSSLLTLCQPLPAPGFKAVLLSKQYMAIMLQQPCVIILKLQLSGKPELQQKNRIYPTNKIYNDIKYICMDYHPIQKCLMFTDFGGYIMRLKFNITNGDLQRQGKVYDQKMGKFLTANTTNTKRQKQFFIIQNKLSSNLEKQSQYESTINSPQLNNSPSKKSKTNIQNITIWNNKGSSMTMNNKDSSMITSAKQFEFSLVQIKKQQQKTIQKKKDRSGLSIYAKPENTQFIKVVKNSSRQNMILMAINKDFSTVITYEEQSRISSNQHTENQKDYLYDKTIKLWDINYLTVYQTFKLSLQIAQMGLQFNGLYIVTKERGYLGFYPFLNKTTQNYVNKKMVQFKNKNSSAIQQLEPHSSLGSKVIIQNNEIYFTTQLQSTKNKQKFAKETFDENLPNFNSSTTYVYKITMDNSQKISEVQQIPQKITQLSVKNKMYVLADINADKRYNCHIYNKLGVKQTVINATKYNNFNHMKKIKHFQFNILFWNQSSLKFLGDNLEQSLIVYWGNVPKQNKHKVQFDNNSISSMHSKLSKNIQNIFVGDSNCGILQKVAYKDKSESRICMFNFEFGRIKYQITKIPIQIQISYLNNNLFVCKENLKRKGLNSNDWDMDQQNLQKQIYSRNRSISNISQMTGRSQTQSCIIDSEQYQYINLYDLKSPNQRKCIYCLKYKKISLKQQQLSQILESSLFNPILSNNRFYQKVETKMQSSNLFFANKGAQLILTCLFKIQHTQIQKIKLKDGKHREKIIKNQRSYIIYSRSISSQIQRQANYKPKSDLMTVTKLSNKHNLQYMCQVQSQQRVLGHWKVSFQQLKKRSNITNWTYRDNLHYNKQPSIGTATLDLSQRILSYRKGCKTKTQKGQSIFQIPLNQNNSCDFQIDWIQNQILSNKSFISFNSKEQILLFVLQIKFKEGAKQNGKLGTITCLEQQLQLVNKIQIENDKPVIKQKSKQFQREANNIWQQTKKQLVELIKPKTNQIIKQSQTNVMLTTELQSQNLVKQNSIQKQIKQDHSHQGKTTNIITQKLKQGRSQNQQEHKINKQLQQVSPDQMNAMFKQWQISKEIQKSKKIYQKNNSDQKNQLEKYIKKINLNPQLRQRRIQQLLIIPGQIRRPKLKVGFELISKTLSDTMKNQNIFSLLANQIQNIQNIPQKNQKINVQEALSKKLDGSLQKNKKSQMSSYLVTQFVTTQKKYINPKVSKSLSKNQNRAINTEMTNVNSDYSTLLKKKASSSLTVKRKESRRLSKHQSQNSSSLMNYSISQSINKNNSKSIYSSTDIRLKSSKIQQSSKILSANPEQSPFRLQSIPQGKQYDFKVVKRCHTQSTQRSAVKSLQQSELKIRSIILPKINQNKQKLLQKMKQKKSFIKLINQRLDKSKKVFSTELEQLKQLQMKKKRQKQSAQLK